MFKALILALLEFQTKRFLAKHKPKVIAITGSVGKTSTKAFTAAVLSQRFRVLAQDGNHNTHASVPLAVFDIPFPEDVRSPLVWLEVLWLMERKIRQRLDHEALVLELGTDHPGEIAHFSYLKPDIAVVTAVAPEHMEFFKTIDAVAQEELSVAKYSQLVLVNRDEIDPVFARYETNPNIDTYGTSGVAEYRYTIEDFDPVKGFRGKFISPEYGEQAAQLNIIAEQTIKAAVAAATVGIKLGLTAPEVVSGLQAIRPVPGRMQLLRGLKDSLLLDDTYNSSPRAAIAALQTLYTFHSKQKIAILGSMNELGTFSKEAHEQVGQACDPAQLAWVITIGKEAEQFLAPAAAGRGCQVRSFASPYDAGAFAHSVLETGAVLLAKGSQNGIFAEEALKVLLHSTEEEDRLVRQESSWLAIKEAQFEKFKEIQGTKR